jgi:tetratricopeptide (TPR) repeat protein/CHAT domain-containing protein
VAEKTRRTIPEFAGGGKRTSRGFGGDPARSSLVLRLLAIYAGCIRFSDFHSLLSFFEGLAMSAFHRSSSCRFAFCAGARIAFFVLAMVMFSPTTRSDEPKPEKDLTDGEKRQLLRNFVNDLNGAKTPADDQKPELAEARELSQKANKLRGEGKLKDAVEPARRAAEIYRTSLGERHPAYATSVTDLSELYMSLGDYAKAEPLCRQALKIRKATIGEKHPDYSTSLQNLANVYSQMGDAAKAEPLFIQALSIRKEVLGEKHAWCGLTMYSLAQLYSSKGDYAKAEPLYLQAIEIRKAALGEKDGVYARSLVGLASMYSSMGNYAKAEPLLRQSLESVKAAVGVNNRDYAICLHHLAGLYASTGDYAKAEPLYQQAIDVYKTALGDMHPHYAASLGGLAGLYVSMGEFAKAEPLYHQAIEIQKTAIGERDPSYATSLIGLAVMYEGVEENAKAEPLFRQAIEFNKAALGERHPFYATALGGLARVYSARGNNAQAEPLFQQAIEIYKDAHAEKDPGYASALTGLAGIYRSTGSFSKAEPLFRQVLEINKATFGERHPRYVTSLNNLGLLYGSMGEFAKAELLYRQALEIKKELTGEKDRGYAASLHNLAHLYASMGDNAKAESVERQAIEIYKEVHAEQSPAYAVSLRNLVSVYSSMGEIKKAEPLARRAIEIDRVALGERHPNYANSVNALAALYFAKGDYAKAEPLFRQAVDIYKRTVGEKHLLYATGLHNLANVYRMTGDNAAAESLSRQALQIDRDALGDKHPDYAINISTLGLLYVSTGQYAKAEPLLRKAVEIYRDALGEKNFSYATSLHNLADLDIAMGNYAEAEPLERHALEIRKATLGENHFEYASSLNSLAELYAFSGDFGKAEPLFVQASEICKTMLGEQHPFYATSLGNLAEFYEKTGDYAKAESFSRRAIKIARKQLDYAANVQSERQQFLMAASVGRYLNGFLSIADDANTNGDSVYDEVLAWKGSISARQQAIRRARRAIAAGGSSKAAQQFDELTAASRELSNLSLTMPSPGREATRRRRLAELSGQIEQLERDLAGISREFRGKLDERQRTSDDLRRALPAGMALVDLLEYDRFVPSKEKGAKPRWERRLAAFVVRPDRQVERVELGPVAPIAVAIELWRIRNAPHPKWTPPEQYILGKALTVWKRDFANADPGTKLREWVWEKLEPHLGDAGTVLISPDGATARFPWPALPGKEPGSYLIEQVAIAVVPVPRLLPELLAEQKQADPKDANKPAPATLLLIGDVDYDADLSNASAGLTTVLSGVISIDEQRSSPWHCANLPGSRAQVTAIGDAFEKQFLDGWMKKLCNGEATKETVVKKMPKGQFVHFATHGFFAPPGLRSALSARFQGPQQSNDAFALREVSGYNPGLLSGLALAGVNRAAADGKDDGILTALEIEQLDLGHVELATLSACETGLGETAGGEGVLGLQRAFQIAGAKSVVATLWSVGDEASRSLMIDFYDNLWRKKMSKLEALRPAQLKMLHQGYDRDGKSADDLPRDDHGHLLPFFWAAFVLSGDWR